MKRNILLLLIVLLGSALRIYGINFEVPHPDEYVIVQSAVHFSVADAPLEGYGLYTLYAWPAFTLVYLQILIYNIYFMLGWLLNWFPSIDAFREYYLTDPSSFYLLGRIMCVAFGIGTVAVLYKIAQRQYNHGVGLLAALFLAANFMHSFHSQFTRPDIPSLFLILVTLLYCLKIMDNPELKYYIYAGIFAGLAIATKFTSGIVLLMIFICHFAGEGMKIFTSENKYEEKPFVFFLPIIFGVIIISGSMAVYLYDFTGWIETYLLPDIRTNLQTQAFLNALIKLGLFSGAILIVSGVFIRFSKKARKFVLNGLLNKKLIVGMVAVVICFMIADPLFFLNFKEQMKVFIYTPMFFGENDTFPIAGGIGFIGNALWYIKGSLIWGAGVPLLIIGTMGLIYTLAEKRRDNAVFLVFPVIYFIAICKGNLKWERYVIPMLPFISVYAAVFLQVAVSKIKTNRVSEKGKEFILAVIALCIVVVPMYNILRYDYLLTQKDTRIISKEWIEKEIPHGSKIGQDAYSGDLSEELFDLTKEYSLGCKSFEHYVDNGYQYLIVSDTQYERFLKKPDKFPQNAEFYKDLISKGELVKEIIPRNDLWPKPEKRFSKFHIHISPSIKIYQIQSTDSHG